MRPLIGVPCRRIDEPYWGVRYAVFATYTRAIDLAGGAPVAIPLELSDESSHDLFERLDGLLLAGGADIHPKEFGEEIKPFCGEIDVTRDAIELQLTRRALAEQRPILGICRGIQLLNVAAGGSLYQDIPAKVPNSLHHSHRHGDPFDRRAHAIEIETSSRLAAALGVPRLDVNSLHHQSLKDIGPGLQIVSRAPDGIVEAVEGKSDAFVVGVQFHPEWMLDSDSRMLGLFRAFVQAAREHQLARSRDVVKEQA